MQTSLKSKISDTVDLSIQRKSFSKYLLALFWLIGVIFIFSQQISIWHHRDSLTSYYKNSFNMGSDYPQFFPLLYCFKIFPVGITFDNQTNWDTSNMGSCAQIKDYLKDHGKNLTVTWRFNRTSILFFFPDVWFNHVALNQAQIHFGYYLYFLISLLLLFTILCFSGLPIFGFLLVLLCGSNPAQLYYSFIYNNINASVISTGIIALALFSLFLFKSKFTKQKKIPFIICILLGCLAAFQYDLRLEGAAVFMGIAVGFLFLPNIDLKKKITFLIIFILSAYCFKVAINFSFHEAFKRANKLVSAYGGQINDSPGHSDYSIQWWGTWNGLGDYDKTLAFVGDDRALESYSYSLVPNDSPGFDYSTRLEYAARYSVQNTIMHHPLWYAGILYERFKQILFHNTPYRISYGSWFTDVPLSASMVSIFFIFPFLLMLLFMNWKWLLFFGVVLAIGGVTLGNMAAFGMEFYSILHLFILAYIFCWLLEIALFIKYKYFT